jgi:hypothetical protein
VLHALPLSAILMWSFYLKKVNLCPCTGRGSGVMAPFSLNLSTKWRWVIQFKLRLLYPPPLPGKNAGTNWIGGWLGFVAGLCVLENREVLCFVSSTNCGSYYYAVLCIFSLFVLRKSITDITCNCTSMDVPIVGDWLDITIQVSRNDFTTKVSRLVSTTVVSRLVVGTNVSRFLTLNVSRVVSTTNVSRLVVGTMSVDLLPLMSVELSLPLSVDPSLALMSVGLLPLISVDLSLSLSVDSSLSLMSADLLPLMSVDSSLTLMSVDSSLPIMPIDLSLILQVDLLPLMSVDLSLTLMSVVLSLWRVKILLKITVSLWDVIRCDWRHSPGYWQRVSWQWKLSVSLAASRFRTISTVYIQAGINNDGPVAGLVGVLRARAKIFYKFRRNPFTVSTQHDIYIYIYTHTHTHTHTHIPHNIETLAGWKKLKKNGTVVNVACPGNLSAHHFGHSCHRFLSPGGCMAFLILH